MTYETTVVKYINPNFITPVEHKPMEDVDFNAFWAAYPRKVAKLAALKAWRKVATSEALVEQIMAGLRAQLPEMLKTYKRDRSMVPHPATWLNGRRWEDVTPNVTNCDTRRHIACEKCGDTGIRVLKHGFTRCVCIAGQLTGLMTGPIHAEDAL